MHKTVIADASCFIVLEKIGFLFLLERLYSQIYTIPEVANEYELPLPSWVTIESAIDTNQQRSLEELIDPGEASAIALALEIPNSLIILDDDKAQKVAQRFGIEITSTIGIFLKARLAGHIPAIAPILSSLKKAGFFLSPALESVILTTAGEQQ
jgi:predicted nucleic acid-binding protein